MSALDPLLDAAPVDTAALGQGSLLQRLSALRSLRPLLRAGTSGMPEDPDGCSSPGHRLLRSPSWGLGRAACPGTATQVSHHLSPPGLALGRQLPRYYEVLTAPISKVSAGSGSVEPPAASLPACEGAAEPPAPNLMLSFIPGPDPGSVV